MSVPRSVITWEHQQVHAGNMYHVSNASATLADGASMGFAIVTGDEDFHAFFALKVEGNARYILYEDAVVTASTVVTAQNMNREFSNALETAFGHTPTFTAGSVLFNVLAVGGEKKDKAVGEERQGTEWVLKPDATYIISGCNLSGTNSLASFVVVGYEL